MRRLKFLLEKEFKQIFRDKTIIAMIFLLPVLQLVLIPLAMNFDVKEINVVIVDNDHSSYSQKFVSKLGASGYFQIIHNPPTYEQATPYLDSGDADAIIAIPPNFEKNLVREGRQQIGIFIDAINGTKSSLGSAYILAVLQDYNREIQLYTGNSYTPPQQIEVTHSLWYNPLADYYWFSVPGVLVLLVTIVGGFLTSLNIVSEKELGTIEQINVSPISKWEFILAKMIPFWIVGMLIFTIGLLISWAMYGVVPQGSLLNLYSLTAIYLIALLGFGLLISTFSDNQLQSMFIAYFFIMIFIMMSGLFTSIDSMPYWARVISDLLPISHYMTAVRNIIVKGSGFIDLKWTYIYEFIFAIVLNALAIWNYRKTD
ncbi:MAG: ABC transporter permease [Weeksellaceae bacterium]